MEGCNDIANYSLLNYINEGAYGVVYRARDNITGSICAIKKVKLPQNEEGIPLSCLREMNILKSLSHPNIINIKDVTMDKSHGFSLVMEYAENDLRDLIQNRRYKFSITEIKTLMKQLLEALAYLHHKKIIHRDLKTSNLLYNNKGELKICDFGLSRKIEDINEGGLTPTVVTLLYRAPELLLGTETYDSSIDMWSVGCIFAELLLGEPLFKGRGELEQIDLIFRIMGTPTETTWPNWKELKFARYFQGNMYPVNRFYEIFAGFSIREGIYLDDNGLELLEGLLNYDPSKRLTAEEALSNPWFQEDPYCKKAEEMPRFFAAKEEGQLGTKKSFK